jgi:hypothetical protein
MDTERVKLIVRNIELLVDALKAEIYTNQPAYKFEDIEVSETDYDQITNDLI